MSKADISIVDSGGKNVTPVIVCNTEANTTVLNAGEPVKFKSAGSKYVIPVADVEPLIGTTVAIVGITASGSTQTAAADGTVEVYLVDSSTVLRAKAKTASAANTDAEIIALKGKRVPFDLTSSVFTIDTAYTDGATNGLLIVGGDASTSSIDFVIRPAALEGPIA